MEQLIQERKKAEQDIAAVIVEPIQGEGGDNHGSPAFFQVLRDITAKHGVVFIVDEVFFPLQAEIIQFFGLKYVKYVRCMQCSGEAC